MQSTTKTKKSIAKKNIVVLLLSLCMLLAVVPAVIFSTVPGAEAATNATANSAASLTTAINAAKDGELHTITLTGSFTVTTAYTIPANKIIVFNMGGYTLKRHSTASAGPGGSFVFCPPLDRQDSPVFTINAGSSVTFTGGGQVRCTASVHQSADQRYTSRTAIENYGNLIIDGTYIFTGGGQPGDAGASNAGTEGSGANDDIARMIAPSDGLVDHHAVAITIRNYASGTVEIKSGTVKAVAISAASSNIITNGYSSAYAYAIYNTGGKVDMSGGSVSAYSRTSTDRISGSTKADADMSSQAVGINNVRDGSGNVPECTLSGGDITVEACYGSHSSGASTSGSANFWGTATGIGYTNNDYPTITGGNIDTSISTFGSLSNNKTESNISVGNPSTSATGQSSTTGTYVDDEGNLTTVGRDKDISGGGAAGQAKLTYVYRYWPVTTVGAITASVTPLVVTDTASSDFVDRTTGKVRLGYTDVPSGNLTALGTTQGSVNDSLYLGYISGAGVRNTRYYQISSVTLRREPKAAATSNHNAYNQANDTRMTTFASGTTDPAAPGAITQNNATSVLANNKIYIYVDYIMKTGTNVRAALSTTNPTANTATVAFANRAILPGADFPFYIYDMAGKGSTDYDNHVNITDRFTLNGTGPNLVSYSYKSASSSDPFVPGTPTDVGTYTMRAKVPADRDYSPTALNTNALQTDYEFTLIIEKASPSVTVADPLGNLTYGDPLSTININSLGVINSANLQGTFTWDTPNSLDNVTGIAQEYAWTFTPNASHHNSTNFKVFNGTTHVTIVKRNITLRFNASTIMFGNLAAVYNVEFDGIADKDQSLIPYWTSLINFFITNIAPGSSEKTYAAGDNAGAYTYRAFNFPDTNNYNVSYGSPGNLTIMPRTLTINVDAHDKRYDGNAVMQLSYECTDGLWGGDSANAIPAHTFGSGGDVYISAPLTGQAITSAVYEIDGDGWLVTFDFPTLGGSQAGNYVVTESSVIGYGGNLYAKILKALPIVNDPVVTTGLNYDSTRTLSQFVLPAVGAGETPGTWSWKAEDLAKVPTVNNDTFTAVFTPNVSSYFDKKEVQINLDIKKQPVTITVETLNTVNVNEIVYGDAVPAYKAKYLGFTGTDTESTSGLIKSGNVAIACNYNTNNVARRNAGEYPITITSSLIADNYSFTVDNDVKLTVKKALLSVSVAPFSITYGFIGDPMSGSGIIEYSGFKYNEKADTVPVSSTISTPLEDAISAACPTYTPANRGAGTYDIEFEATCPAETQNYTINYSQGVKLTVNKKNITIAAKDITLGYGDAKPDFTNPIYDTDYDVVGENPFAYDDTYANSISGIPNLFCDYNAASTVGTYPIIITVGSLTSNNYNITVQNGTLTCEAATPAIAPGDWPQVSLAWGDTLGSAVLVNNTGIEGFFSFVAPETIVNGAIGVNGPYSMKFTPASKNYKEVTNDNILVTVTAKPISGRVGISGSPVVGETLTVDTSGMNPSNSSNYEYEWIVAIDGTPTSVGVGKDILMDDAWKSCDIYVKVTAKLPYTGESTSTTALIVPSGLTPIDKDAHLTIGYIAESYLYNGNNRTVSVTTTQSPVAMGAITVKYNGGTALPRNVGTYVVTVDIEAGGAFAPVAGLYIGTFEITPAPYFISFTPNHKTYDGYDTATIDYSSFQQSGVIGSDVVSLEKAINAYQYKFPQSAAGNNLQVTMVGAKLVGAAAQNYEIRYNTSTTVANINKRVLNLTTAKNQYERDYIAGDNSVALTFDKYEDLDGVLSFDRRTVKIDSVIGYVNMNSIGVGTRSIETVNVVLSGENSQNYTYTITNLPSLTLRINQAHPVGITAAPDIAPVTYNGYRTLSSLPIPGNTQSRWQWVNPAAIPQVVNSGYDIRYNPGDANYLTVTYTATVEVYPATLTVRIDKISDVTYGNETPQFTAVFNGLSGSDTVDDIGGTLVINTTYTQGSPVGAYSAVVDDSLLFSTNYNVVFDSTTGKFNVVPKEISIEPTASNRVYSEGNRYVNVYYGALNGVIAGDNVFINNGSGADIGNNPVIGEMSNENAGTGKAVYYPVPALGGTDSANYSLIYPASITVDIAQAVPTYSPPNSASINFGQRLSAAVFSGGSGDGIFIYENPDYIPTAVGTISEIYVQFIPTNSNYRTERYRVPLTVKASQPAFTVSINGSFNIGETLHAATDLDSTARQYATYKWYYAEGGTIIGTPIHEGTSYTLTQADIDKHIVLVVTLQSPYEGERTFYATQRVQEENLTFWQKLARWWYRLISAIQGIFGII